MTTVTVNDKYIETIKSFTDIETATNIAFKRYVIEPAPKSLKKSI